MLEPRTPKLYEVHHATTSPIAFEAFGRSPRCSPSRAASADDEPSGAWPARGARQAAAGTIKGILDTSLDRVSGKSALAQAIRYALSRWKALTRYITDGRLEMSNNAAERAMKPPCLGGKTTCSVAPTPVDSAPPASTPSSKLLRCAASIRRPIWLMSSIASLITRSVRSTLCSHGAGQNSARQVAATNQKPRPTADAHI